MKAEQLLLGVDVGTGSARAGLFTSAGDLRGRGEHVLRTWNTRPHHVEQSSADIWSAVCAAVRMALAKAGADAGCVVGIGFDATCSLVALDAGGQPVTISTDGDDARNVVVWMDHRATADAAFINATSHPVLQFVGGAISPEMQTPKLRWLKRELPQTWQRTRHWMDLPDFLTWRATGSLDRSLCSTVCKWTYLGHEGRWDPSYFERIGLADLSTEKFERLGTRIRTPGELVGPLSLAAARELGLTPGIAVAASLIDAHAGALGTLGASGSDVTLSQRLAVIAGTSACHLAVSDSRVDVPGVWGPYFEALMPRRWLLEAGISASGAFLDHVLRVHPASREIDDPFTAAENELARLVAAGADLHELVADLHFQPNVLGNRAPLADPLLTGGVSGWTLRSDVEDLARWYLAALQALAYATRHIMEAMGQAGCDIGLLIASGGSANNPRWCQIHADALGIPVGVAQQPEAVLLGSAMLAARASGTTASLEDAMSGMTRLGRIYAPATANRAFHDAKYAVYRRMIDDQRAYASLMAQARTVSS
jgi:FGGY-family pentulose kinase